MPNYDQTKAKGETYYERNIEPTKYIMPDFQSTSQKTTPQHKKEIEKELVDKAVNRFLAWKLPENFNPDGGISFKKVFNEHTGHPTKAEPVGTNLLDATQAERMVRHMLADILSSSLDRVRKETLEEVEKLAEKYFGGIVEGTAIFYRANNANAEIEKYLKDLSLLQGPNKDNLLVGGEDK